MSWQAELRQRLSIHFYRDIIHTSHAQGEHKTYHIFIVSRQSLIHTHGHAYCPASCYRTKLKGSRARTSMYYTWRYMVTAHPASWKLKGSVVRARTMYPALPLFGP